MAVEHRDGGSPGTFHKMGERRAISLLALVHRRRPGGFDQHFGLDHQTDVVRQSKHPGCAIARSRARDMPPQTD